MSGGTTVPELPLVGRSAELAAAAVALGEPSRSGLVLAGAAGVGKTRLAHECASLATTAGFAVASVAATRAATAIPLGTLAPLLPPRPAGSSEGVDAVRRATAAIARVGRGRPVLLVVDDAHLLDPVSAVVVHQVAERSEVFVIVVVRTGEPAPDPITALWKEAHAVRLDLAPLSRHDVDLVAEGALGGPVHTGLANELWRLSAGNALFLRELLVAGLASASVSCTDGRWRLDGRLPTTARLIDLIGGRLDNLEPLERRALELVAFGEPITATLVEAMSSPEAVASIQRQTLARVGVGEGDQHELRLAHPLYGEVLREQTPPTLVPRIHSLLADAVTERGLRQGDRLRVATWRLHEPDVHDAAFFADAAQEARVAGDLGLAERLATAAHRAGGGARTAGLLASLVAEAGDPTRAEQLFAAAASEATTDAELAIVAMGRSTNRFAGLGDVDGAFALFGAAAAVVTDPLWRAELVAHSASFDLLAGRPAKAVEAVRPMLDDVASGRPFVQAAIAAVPALVVLGRAVEARALAEQAYAAHQQLGPQPELADASIHLVGQLFAGREAGPIGEVTGLAEMILGVCVELGSTLGQAYFGVQLGGARLAAGRVRSAAAAFDESAVFMRELAQPGRLSWSLAGAAQAYALAGDIDLADERLDELAATRSPERLLEGEMQRAHAWCAVGHGMISQARAILRGALNESRARQTAGVSLWLLHDLARLGSLALGEELDAALRDVQGPLAAARRDHVSAVARQDGDALDGAADAFAALGADLLAADAAAQAAGVHHATGHERRAAASRNQALALAATCEGASTPALATLVTSTLTDREREIAQLAAGGLGNRAIAEQLFVSLRTVENHLQHVYVKLGVDGRHELASVLASLRDLSSAHS